MKQVFSEKFMERFDAAAMIIHAGAADIRVYKFRSDEYKV